MEENLKVQTKRKFKVTTDSNHDKPVAPNLRNVVIGGQSFSLTFDGFMNYSMPIIPHDGETFKEWLGGALLVAVTPFVIFYFLNMVFPVFYNEDEAHG